jgi:hypothetical protein
MKSIFARRARQQSFEMFGITAVLSVLLITNFSTAAFSVTDDELIQLIN